MTDQRATTQPVKCRLPARPWKPWVRSLSVALALPTLGLIAPGVYVAILLTDDEPVAYAEIDEDFKYGSTGSILGSIFDALICTTCRWWTRLPSPA